MLLRSKIESKFVRSSATTKGAVVVTDETRDYSTPSRPDYDLLRCGVCGFLLARRAHKIAGPLAYLDESAQPIESCLVRLCHRKLICFEVHDDNRPLLLTTVRGWEHKRQLIIVD
jgi:hypothetical protein